MPIVPFFNIRRQIALPYLLQSVVTHLTILH
jgi:hypothetical protein